jgi:hypothetical protein
MSAFAGETHCRAAWRRKISLKQKATSPHSAANWKTDQPGFDAKLFDTIHALDRGRTLTRRDWSSRERRERPGRLVDGKTGDIIVITV